MSRSRGRWGTKAKGRPGGPAYRTKIRRLRSIKRRKNY